MQSGFFVNPPQHSVSNSKNQANTATENKAKTQARQKKHAYLRIKKEAKASSYCTLAKKIIPLQPLFIALPRVMGN
ncbi:unknown [Prevotella sp. CAG:873]|nr:unknown [Prevotella sp. CAG:873]